MVAVRGPLFTDCDLGRVSPNTVCLIRKLILSNGLFGWVARMAICLCTEMIDNRGFGRFHSSGKLHPLPLSSVLGFFSLLALFYSSPPLCLFIALFACLYSFGVIFTRFLPVGLSIFFLFLSASPPSLSALHFGHPITRRSSYSDFIQSSLIQSGPSNSHSNYILNCLQSRRSAKCCFQTVLGPPPNLIPQT